MAANHKSTTNSALEAVSRLTLEEAAMQNNEEVEQKEKARMTLAQRYKTEKKYTVIGAPMYAAYFGDKMPIILHGIPIYVPLDGNRYEIPESYAMVFNERIRSVNDQIKQQKKMSDVTANIESFPGEKDLIRRV